MVSHARGIFFPTHIHLIDVNNLITSVLCAAFALKGIEFKLVPVNLIKDGGQQVLCHKADDT